MKMNEYFKGQTITKVRRMSKEEMEELNWEDKPWAIHNVMELSGGGILIPASDESLNSPGYMLIKRDGKFYGI